MEDLGAMEPDMEAPDLNRMPNQGDRSPDVAYGDAHHNLTRPLHKDEAGKPMTAEALDILGAGQSYGSR